MEIFANWFFTVMSAYLGVGAVFALAFVFKGAARIDPDAQHGTLGFRILIMPGAAALWPLLLRRWLSASGPPTERSAHRRAAAQEEARA